jgi:hypothetical protein
MLIDRQSSDFNDFILIHNHTIWIIEMPKMLKIAVHSIHSVITPNKPV